MNNLKIFSGDLMMNIKTKTGKTLKILLALLFSVLIAGVAYAEDMPADPIQQDKLEAGKKVYFKRCVWCHGVEGVGDGPSHDRLFTKPRNFIQGTFKIRWTDSGELPRDQEMKTLLILLRTVLQVRLCLPGVIS